MYFLPYFTESARKQQFDLGVYILYRVFQGKVPFFYFTENLLQACGQPFKFIRREQSDAFQHFYMGHRALHIIFSKSHVEYPVISDSEVFHHLCGFLPFVPECFRH